MWILPENGFKYAVYYLCNWQTQFYCGTSHCGNLNCRLSDGQLFSLERLFDVPPVVIEHMNSWKWYGRCGDIMFNVSDKGDHFALKIEGSEIPGKFQFESFAFGYVAQEAYRRKMKQDNTFWAE